MDQPCLTAPWLTWNALASWHLHATDEILEFVVMSPTADVLKFVHTLGDQAQAGAAATLRFQTRHAAFIGCLLRRHALTELTQPSMLHSSLRGTLSSQPLPQQRPQTEGLHRL